MLTLHTALTVVNVNNTTRSEIQPSVTVHLRHLLIQNQTATQRYDETQTDLNRLVKQALDEGRLHGGLRGFWVFFGTQGIIGAVA